MNEKTLTFEEYWKAIAAKNPGLDKAYEEGEKHGRMLQAAKAQNADMFNTFFGGRR